jgi:hypothetical protein
MIVHEMNELMFQIVCIILARSLYVICLLDMYLLIPREEQAFIPPTLKRRRVSAFPYPSVQTITLLPALKLSKEY